MSRSLKVNALPLNLRRFDLLAFPQPYLSLALSHSSYREFDLSRSAVYWLIKSNDRELARHLRGTCCGLQISCLVSLSRLRSRNIQRSARVALGRSRIRGLICGCGCVVVRCLDVSWLADDADAWRFAANRLTSKREAASWYPSWNLNINSVSNAEREYVYEYVYERDTHCNILARLEQFAGYFEYLSLSINIIHNESLTAISLSGIKEP